MRQVEAGLGILHHKERWCTGATVDPKTGYITYYQYPCGPEPHEPPPPTPPPAAPAPPSLIVQFHEDFHTTSHRPGVRSLSLQPGWLYADLTKVQMTGMWPWNKSWNDQISGVTLNGSTVVIAEHTNFEGTKLLLWPQQHGSAPIDLAALGWNDRASSIWNFGAAL
jgi:hypothetical protein